MLNKIGNFKPKNRIFLAPMLEPNDIAFRMLCRKYGCGLTYTGMINPLSKQKLILDDKPALQIFCNNTKGVKSFIKKHEKNVSLFDFNLGCPSALAKKMKFGSFLHDDINAIEKILKTMRESTKKPITIKLRKSKKTFEIIEMAKNYVDAICIHPRTSEEGYSGEPELDFAKKIKKMVNVPVIYSGNVNLNNIDSLLKTFDFVMVGREAIGNPSIFQKNANVKFSEYIELAEKYKIYFRQIKFQAMCFTKKMKNAKTIRNKLSKTKNIKEIIKIMSV